MTPEQKLKYAILDLDAVWQDKTLPTNLTGEEVDELWDDAEDIYEAMYEIRNGGVETGLVCQSSRHYESEAVAVQCPTGDWVGFTYWYGGGKHGDPESIDWIEYAYDVTCKEEQKMVTVRTFIQGTQS